MTDLPTLHVHFAQVPARPFPEEVLDPSRESGFTEQVEAQLVELYREAMTSEGPNPMEVTVRLASPAEDEEAPSVGEFGVRRYGSREDEVYLTPTVEDAHLVLANKSVLEHGWEVVSRIVFIMDGDRYEGPWKTLAETEASIERSEAARLAELAGPR
jgi:hypothetical protein